LDDQTTGNSTEHGKEGVQFVTVVSAIQLEVGNTNPHAFKKVARMSLTGKLLLSIKVGLILVE
jgi:hypothetical protein